MRPLTRRALVLPAVLLAGTLRAVLSQSNPVVASIPLGRLPGSIIVDESTGQAFAYNRGDGSLTVVNIADGKVVGTLPNLGAAYGGLALAEKAGRLFVGSDGVVSVVDVRGDTLLRTIPAVAAAPEDLAVDEAAGRAYVGHAGSDLVSVLDLRSDAPVGQFKGCQGASSLAVSRRTGHLFVACTDGTIAMLDRRTGRLLRTMHTGITWGALHSSEASDVVVESGAGGEPSQPVDARAGTPILHAALPPLLWLDAGGALFGASLPSLGGAAQQGAVWQIDPRTGVPLRQFASIANPAFVAINPRTGHLLILSVGPVDPTGEPLGPGSLTVSDARSGALLRTIALGGDPLALAMDPRRDRLLVVNGYATLDGSLLRRIPAGGGWLRILRPLERITERLPFAGSTPASPPTHGTLAVLRLSDL